MQPHDEQGLTESGWETRSASRSPLVVLWQRKPLVLLAAIVGLGLGSFYYVQKTPLYQSSAQVLVLKKRGSDALPIAGGDPRLNYVEDYMSTHLVLLRSPLIVDRAVKRRELHTLKSFETNGDATGAILASLTVNRDTKESSGSGPNNIVLLSYRAPVAEDCGKVLNAIIESYQEFLDITYRNVSDQTLELITKARDVVKKDLDESQEKYRKFRLQSPNFWRGKDGTTIHQERVTGIETKRSQLLIRQAELREWIKTMEKAIAEGKGLEALQRAMRPGDPKAKPQEEQLIPLLAQEQELLEDFGEDHPKVKAVRKRIALMKDFIERAYPGSLPGGEDISDPAKRHLQLLRLHLQDTDASLKSMNDLLEELRRETKDLSNFEIAEEHLRGDIARLQQLYDGTIKRLTEINLVRDQGGFDARTLSSPGIGAKVAPSLFQNVMGGLMLGLLGGVGLAYLAERLDKSFRTPEEVRRQLGLPLIGHIPYLKPDPDSAAKAAAGEPTLDPMLCAHYRPKSLEAEAYRALRTAVFFSTQGEMHKVLQITSPNKGDGKSLLLANLAISIAQSGKRVIIVDADCRRPRQHKIFNLANTAGLTCVIGRQASWRDCVQTTPMTDLSVLPCGPIPPNPAELLTSPRFKELLGSLRPEYDFVLVDSPPLLAVTDPCIVGGCVDGLFLTLRLTRKVRPHAERAKEILAAHDVKVYGVVVNGVGQQGMGGLYSSEQYDYAESYEDTSEEDGHDGYYYAEEPEASAAAVTTAVTSEERS